MEAAKPPVVIPVWLTGFDRLMPEGRKFPYKYFPRPGARLSVTFGEPIPAETIQAVLARLKRTGLKEKDDLQDDTQPPESKGWIGQHVTSEQNEEQRIKEILKVRSEVTAIIHDAVESLGHSVCGPTLMVPDKS
jgi:monolysocardiolipin acyltransferase